MPIKTYKPTTPSRRHTVLVDTRHLSKVEPKKSLLAPLKSKAGRNVRGKITVRHQGGGVKRQYRIIDFKRDKFEVKGLVETMEYDPNRSAFIALIKYSDGDKRYILAPEGLKIGDEVLSSVKEVIVNPGNSLPLSKIPVGTTIHNVELYPGSGASIARSAGMGVQLMGVDKGYAQIKLPSGEVRLVSQDCMASIGVVGNSDHGNVKLGKAGRARRKGVRPGVRGVAMSSKHPHGGGQGKSGRHGPGGPAKDRWGNKVGLRTRKNKRTNKFIMQRVETKKRKAKKFKTVI